VTDTANPPMNLDAEESVLSAMMLSRAVVPACAEILQPPDFYRASHARIFRAIIDLDLNDEPTDAISVTERLAATGQLNLIEGAGERIHELSILTPAAANAAHYARIVRDHAQLRALVKAGNDISRLGWERPGEVPDLVEQAEQIVFDLAHKRSIGDLQHIGESLHETHDRMVATQHTDVTGTPTGIRQLDIATAGFQNGNLVVLAARPSMGKSALAITALHHVAAGGKPVALFSLEMSKMEVNQRLLSIETNLQLRKIRQSAKLEDSDWTTVAHGFSKLERLPIFIDDSGDLRVMELRSRARRLKAKHPDLALVVVDYLQLMIGEQRPENRVQEVSQISRGLKLLARDLEVPVLALSQLSRAVEQRFDKRPILSDLRDSGSIEQDADLVLFVYRDAVYKQEPSERDKEQAELILAKHRNGPLATVHAHWDARHAAFRDAA
jgi:replicative DNA helicase